MQLPSDPPAVGALCALLMSAGVRCVRKRRLLVSAITRRVLARLDDGPVKEAVRASVEFGEQLSYDADGEEGDERTRLIRSYDRRQLIQPVADVIRRLREPIEAAGEYSRSPTYWVLSAAYRPLDDDAIITSAGNNFGWAARTAIICQEQQAYDPEWRDLEVFRHADFQEAEQQLALGRDIFGGLSPSANFSADWRTDTVLTLARTMYESREFGAMPILADALQDAGCDNTDILDHCRNTKPVHVRGCWVVDLVLSKN